MQIPFGWEEKEVEILVEEKKRNLRVGKDYEETNECKFIAKVSNK